MKYEPGKSYKIIPFIGWTPIKIHVLKVFQDEGIEVIVFKFWKNFSWNYSVKTKWTLDVLNGN